MTRFVTFGEIMLRLAGTGHRRLVQSIPGALSATFAGSESNVAAALAHFGHPTQFVTALPNNMVGDACLASLRSEGIDVSRIVIRDNARLGQFYVETGANQRPTRIEYDRVGSAVSLTSADAYNWSAIMQGADWLHISGITPAISASGFAATLAAVESAAATKATISMDVNFRSALWRWDDASSPDALATRSLRDLLPHVHVLFTGLGDAELLGVDCGSSGDGDAVQRLTAFSASLVRQYPQLRYVALSLREQQSASANAYGCGLFIAHSGTLLRAPLVGNRYCPWQIHQIVDRVGTGDAFAAGLLHGLSCGLDRAPAELQHALEFATAAGCLAHSVEGDILYASEEEIEQLLGGDSTGRVQR